MTLRRTRRGSALLLVLMVTLAVAGLAISAIFLSSSSSLLSANVDRERDYRFAAISVLNRALDTLRLNPSVAVPSTGFGILGATASTPGFDQVSVLDAAGDPLSRVRVTVFVGETGRGTPGIIPTFTLLAVVNDGRDRYAHRYDLRRESFSSFALFVDGAVSFGPAVLPGRVHANGNYTILSNGRQLENIFLDSLSATGSITGDSLNPHVRQRNAAAIEYPALTSMDFMPDSASPASLHIDLPTLAVSRARVEFFARDLDGADGIEENEAFLGVFSLANRADAGARRAVRPLRTRSGQDFSIDVTTDPVILRQCGAFYRRARTPGSTTFFWHFVPVASHWKLGFRELIAPTTTTTGNYPTPVYADVDQPVQAEIETILSQPTARCFPPGSPYLMPVERFPSGVAWGAGTPPTGWTYWYGGMDTTFTAVVQTCDGTWTGTPTAGTPSPELGDCWANGTGSSNNKAVAVAPTSLGSWLAFPAAQRRGTVPDTFLETYGWPLHTDYNRGRLTGAIAVTTSATDSLYVSGVVRGRWTLWTNGVAVLVDRLRYAQDPNANAEAGCTNQLGLVAKGDVLVVAGATSRIYSFGKNREDLLAGGEPRFTIHGSLMSLGGSVAPMFADSSYNDDRAPQYSCPEDEQTRFDDSNGGCFAVTGGIAMKVARAFSGTGVNAKQARNKSFAGMRYAGGWDQCGRTDRRPPLYPLTSRFRLLSSHEVNLRLVDSPTRRATFFARLLTTVF